MTLTGMDGLLRALRETPEIARAELAYAVSASVAAIAQRMRATVPRRSGLLRSSISTSTRSTQRGIVGRVEIGIDPFYWHFLEFGTVNMAARPFIRPAGELEAPAFEESLRTIAQKMERAWTARSSNVQLAEAA